MELRGSDLDRIPRTNLHVPVAEFARLWVAVEAHQDAQRDRGVVDWYGEGVRATCRWIARAVIRPSGGRRGHLAYSPVTETQRHAYEELIQAESLAADLLDMRRPRPRWLLERPGWSEAIVATLDWTWRGSGRPPVFGDPEEQHRAAG